MIDWGQVDTIAMQAQRQREADYAAWKQARAQEVEAIKVMVDGMTFDGDETSQGRMARAIAASYFPDQLTYWTLADNRIAQVTVAQLRQALLLASTEQTRIWNDGRPA